MKERLHVSWRTMGQGTASGHDVSPAGPARLKTAAMRSREGSSWMHSEIILIISFWHEQLKEAVLWRDVEQTKVN